MNEEPFAHILGSCLDRIAAGDQAEACLANYPEHAADLAPLLAAATEMSALRGYTISSAGRQRVRAQILDAEILRNEHRAAPKWRWPGLVPRVSRLATGFAVALLCVVVTTVAVAASQPGDLAYGVRVVAERVPALFVREPEGRARAELGIAERRLGDLDRTRERQETDERAVAALLRSVDDVETQAAGRPDAQRAELAGRLEDQARHLERLGEVAGSAGSRALLQEAALRVRVVARRIWQPGPPVEPPAPGPAPTATRGVHATPTPRSTAGGQVGPTRAPASSHTPLPSYTPGRGGRISGATPKGPSPQGTLQGSKASATPQGPRTSATPQGTGPSTPQGPGPQATPPGPGPEATPQGPGPESTPQGSGPESTPQGPGPESTPQGPGQDQDPGRSRP